MHSLHCLPGFLSLHMSGMAAAHSTGSYVIGIRSHLLMVSQANLHVCLRKGSWVTRQLSCADPFLQARKLCLPIPSICKLLCPLLIHLHQAEISMADVSRASKPCSSNLSPYGEPMDRQAKVQCTVQSHGPEIYLHNIYISCCMF